jgi:hypothetical protein
MQRWCDAIFPYWEEHAHGSKLVVLQPFDVAIVVADLFLARDLPDLGLREVVVIR